MAPEMRVAVDAGGDAGRERGLRGRVAAHRQAVDRLLLVVRLDLRRLHDRGLIGRDGDGLG